MTLTAELELRVWKGILYRTLTFIYIIFCGQLYNYIHVCITNFYLDKLNQMGGATLIIFTFLKHNLELNVSQIPQFIRDRPFNLKGLWFFVSFRIVFTDNIRVRIFFFFPQNLTLGYTTKTLNQVIFFFPPPKSEYFFQQHWESEYFF